MDTSKSLWSALCLVFATVGAAGILALLGALPGQQADVSDALLWKVIGTTIVLALAGVQVLLAARLWGASTFPPIELGVASDLHRWLGRVTITFAIVVAVSCIIGPAGATSPTRVLAHSVLGSLVFLILAAKVFVLRISSRGGHLLPWLGAGLFLTFCGIWATSVADYITAR